MSVYHISFSENIHDHLSFPTFSQQDTCVYILWQ